MTQHVRFSIQLVLAVALMTGSFFAGMAVSIANTASIMRQLAVELGEAQKRIAELEDHEKVVPVSADDLDSGTMVVIGRLGRPLNTMLTIRGVWDWSRMPKDSGLVFRVTHVNGEALDEPVIFHQTLVHVRHRGDKLENDPVSSIAQSWEIRAYETGGFSGNPAEYQMELSGLPYVEAEPAWSRNFQTELHGIR